MFLFVDGWSGEYCIAVQLLRFLNSDGCSFCLLLRAAEEELLMLDGIQMYGMGNFRDVSTHVHSKTEAQCLAHYTSAFMSAPKDISGTASSAYKASSTAPVGPPSTAHVPKSEIGGYFPLRGDFDIEHDNDAEKILADSKL
jgi:transcriptional adapter 2-alpha